LTYVCGHCRRSTLAENVAEGQLWGIDFKCSVCGGFSRTPTLPPGSPLPRGTVCLLKGDFYLKVTVDLPIQAVMAGESEVEGRRKNSGWGKALDSSQESQTLDAKAVGQKLSRLKEILGERYDEQVARSRRFDGAHFESMPRLQQVISRNLESASAHEGSGSIYVYEFIELVVLVELLERWRADPTFPRILADLLTEDGYRHSLSTLLAVSQLTDLGNGVGLYGELGARVKVPDFWIQVSAHNRLNVEVKAPALLVAPDPALSREDAETALEGARKDSIKGGRPQLPRDTPGILLLGGVYLSASDLDTLESVCVVSMNQKGPNYSHIAGVMLLSFNPFLNGLPIGRGTAAPTLWQLTGGAQIRWIKNGSYTGEVTIVATPTATRNENGKK
ncbi:MAG: hypothetical protein ACLP74_00305, partial [Thermoplasmata archaeon]